MNVQYLGDIKGDSFTIITTDHAPINRSLSGYGSKIPTNRMVIFGNRKYRIYAICWSNCASHYITILGIKYFIRDSYIN